MKLLLILIIALSSLTAFAAKDPNYCGSEDHCVIGRNLLMLKKGMPYARAEGRNCDEAIELSEDVQKTEHDCKRNDVQPYGCYKTSRGTTKAWTRCIRNPIETKTRASSQQKCAMIFGVIAC